MGRVKKPTNNSFLGNTISMAKIKVINEETNRWTTIGECIDTPKGLRDEIGKDVYTGLSLWVFPQLGSKYYVDLATKKKLGLVK